MQPPVFYITEVVPLYLYCRGESGCRKRWVICPDDTEAKVALMTRTALDILRSRRVYSMDI